MRSWSTPLCVARLVDFPTFQTQVQSHCRTRAVEGNGLAAEFGTEMHALAAEPRETILRVVVLDGDTEVAYETAVLGALRPGYRCFQMRHVKTGTRIRLYHLLLTTYHLPLTTDY